MMIRRLLIISAILVFAVLTAIVIPGMAGSRVLAHSNNPILENLGPNSLAFNAGTDSVQFFGIIVQNSSHSHDVRAIVEVLGPSGSVVFTDNTREILNADSTSENISNWRHWVIPSDAANGTYTVRGELQDFRDSSTVWSSVVSPHQFTVSGGDPGGGVEAPVIVTLGCTPTTVPVGASVTCSPQISGGAPTTYLWGAIGGNPDRGTGRTFTTSFSSAGGKQIILGVDNSAGDDTGVQPITVESGGGGGGGGDDHGDSIQDATPAGTNATHPGNIETNGDDDFFSFSATGGNSYVFSTALGGLHDSVLTLYDSSGGTLARNDDHGGSLASQISWTAPSSGTYYIKVEGYSSNTGTYGLNIEGGDGVEAPVIVTLGCTPTTLPVGASVTCSPQISGGAPTTYLWGAIGGNPDRGTGRTFTTSFSSAGGKQIILGVDNSAGDDTGVASITVESGGGGGGGGGDDHGDSIQDATPAGTNATHPGNIETNGDDDFFSFSATGSNSYVFSTALGDLDDSVLTLYDSSGGTLARNDDHGGSLASQISWTAPSSGTYYIKVEGYSSNTGTYGLNIEEERGGVEAPVIVTPGCTPTTVPVGASVTCSPQISGGAPTTYLWGAIGGNPDRGTGRTFTTSFSSAGGKQIILGVDNSAGDDTGVQPITVESGGGGGGGGDDHGDSIQDATPAGTNATHPGNIETNGDDDFFSFSATGGNSYVFSTALGGLHDSVLTLYDSSGGTLARNDDHGGSLASQISWTAPSSGTYYIKVEGYSSNTGTYGLNIEGGDGVEAPVIVTLGCTPTTLPVGASVTCSPQISGGAPTTYLWGAIGGNPDRGTGRTFTTSFSSAGGKQIILGVDNSAGDDTGVASITVESGGGGGGGGGDDHGDSIQDATPAGTNATHPGNIETNGDDDFFSFSATGSNSYVFSTALGDLDDSVLTLYDSSGGTLARNDDHGGSLASQISWTAPSSGTYYIKVEGYSSNTGTYGLNIEEERGGVEAPVIVTPGCTPTTVPVGASVTCSPQISGGAPTTYLWGAIGGNPDRGTGRTFTTSFSSAGGKQIILGVDNSAGDDTGVQPITVESGGGGGGGGDDHGDSIQDATPAGTNATHPGNIETNGDDDFFSFSATGSNSYVFSTALGDLDDSVLTLYDSSGGTLARNDDHGGSLASQISWTAPSSGTYYIKVEGYSSNTGTYGLNIEEERGGVEAPVIVTPGCTPTTVPVGASVTCSPQISGGAPTTYLWGAIGGNPDRGTGRTFTTSFSSAGGKQIILGVDNSAGDDTGVQPITVVINGGGDDHGDSRQDATPAGTNATHPGNIETNGDDDFFSFSASGGNSYVFSTALGGLHDSVLTLQDSSGRQLRRNDNDGTSLASRIGWTAPSSGTYYIKVEGSGSNTGTYALNVEGGSGGRNVLLSRRPDRINDSVVLSVLGPASPPIGSETEIIVLLEREENPDGYSFSSLKHGAVFLSLLEDTEVLYSGIRKERWHGTRGWEPYDWEPGVGETILESVSVFVSSFIPHGWLLGVAEVIGESIQDEDAPSLPQFYRHNEYDTVTVPWQVSRAGGLIKLRITIPLTFHSAPDLAIFVKGVTQITLNENGLTRTQDYRAEATIHD